MWRVGLAMTTLLFAGCSGSTSGGGDAGNYKSQYLDVERDEAEDRVSVDAVRMERTWNYIQVKATKAMVHVAVNREASKAAHEAALPRANEFVILSGPAANMKAGDYLSFCGMSGGISSVSFTIGDSGSNEELVTIPFGSVRACG